MISSKIIPFKEVESKGVRVDTPQWALDRLKTLDAAIPECCKRHILSAEMNYAMHGDIPDVAVIDDERALILIPPRLDGPKLLKFLAKVGKKSDAKSVCFAYVGIHEELTMFYLTPEIEHLLQCPVVDGKPQKWRIHSVKAVQSK